MRDKNSITNQTQITSGMGYISTIQEARKSLEKIYTLKKTIVKLNKEFLGL